MANPFIFRPNKENSPVSYAFPWNWPAIAGDAFGLFGGGGLFGSEEKPDYYSGMPGNYPAYVGMEPTDIPIGWDRRAEQQFNKEALRPGRSLASELALDQNAQDLLQAKSGVRGQASGLAREAESALAMRGGLDSGARERIAKQGMTSALDLTQQAEAQAGKNRTAIDIADEQNRLAGLESAAGMNRAGAQTLFGMQDANRTAREKELARRNAYNMNFYNQQMAGWAAGKQAQATENSGKK